MAAALSATVLGPAAAGAHGGSHPSTASASSTTAQKVSRAMQSAIGGKPRPAGRNLYRVRAAGVELVTHGPDPRARAAAAGLGGRRATAAGARAASTIGFSSGDAERSPVCATDSYQHVLYGRTATAADRYAEVVSDLRAAVRRMNAVLNAEGLESGGLSADYKLLCDSGGQIRVDGFVSTGSSFNEIVTGARAAGFDASNANYTIFFDASSSYCGIASYLQDESLSLSNLNNQGGGYAVSYRPCWFNETPMHENGHNMGAVQYGAPNSTGSGGHCYDEADVMCYSPDGGDLNQGGTVSRCTDRVHFDCGHDDYFNVAALAGTYLFGSWNIGSALNRFTVLGLPPTDDVTGDGDTDTDGGLSPVVPPPVVDPGIVTLIDRVRTAGSSAAPGEWRHFRVRVPRGRKALRVVLKLPDADGLNLYLRRGSEPTLGRYACRAARDRGGAGKRCNVRAPRAGRWFAGVYSASAEEGTRFNVRAILRR